ncbi:uncharacterized protein EDB91DRAFT_1281413 [Suillus paluster]|uniref:uncharacterized protein n=1 Tax=Suillus paluster TaxID=48578 RepID=UPI001B86ACFB|nr:uncharacterized protein EDB91DRAFT_1257437 [Suillus paluster]XP_041168905.1 uncharacterized protein EDB91DRAFT_1281413 [Suillus paluster]KAG1719732.1 hypothetical protein EDB91DRAFT_1257437 [Suillus paluster]KAG1720346.1 hypothetical protein EDB91DRAFT_1281413 [Suillus paluster]
MYDIVPTKKSTNHISIMTAENELKSSLQELKARNRIFGEPLSLDELLEPAEEKQIGDSLGFDLNGGDMAIVVAVSREIAKKQGEVIEADSDDDSEENHDAAPEVSRVEALALCQRLEGACLQQ